MFIQASQKTAIVWKDEQISYQDVLNKTGQFASLFEAAATNKVAVFSENRPEWVFAFYSAWLNDSIAVPIDFMASAEEVAYILNDCRPEILFGSRETEEKIAEAKKLLKYDLKIIIFEDSDFSAVEVGDVTFDIADIMETAVIIYTSGTTGSPKGVMLSYDNLLANVEAVSQGVKIYTADRNVMVLLPLHHIFPLLGTMVAPLSVGSTIAFSPTLNSEDIMATLQNNKVAIIIGVPRLYSVIRKGIKDKINAHFATRSLYKLAEKMNSMAFSRKLFKSVHKKFGGHVDFMVSGGAKLDENVARDFRTLGFEVLEGYGMTESAPMITFTRPGRVKVGSAGESVTTLEVSSFEGEIVARGRNIMKGYYNRPEETAEVIKDGWLHTGDLGHMDKEGFIHITGRKKEIMVLSSGKNINPEEIEHKISEMSDLINEIGVFLKDDIIHAAIYPNFLKIKEKGITNIEETIRWEIIDRYNNKTSPYKKILKFMILKDELPKTRLGKVQRFKLALLSEGPEKGGSSKPEPNTEEYAVIKNYLENQVEDKINPDDHFEIDLGMDSLDKVSFSTFLQSTFGLDTSEDILINHPTVEKLSSFIKDKKVKISVEAVKWAEIFKEKVEIHLPKSWFTQNLFKNSSRVVLKSYFRLKAEGLENLPKGPFILAPNHQSFLDALFVAIFLKNKLMKNTYFYAKEKHVRNRIVKFFANRNNVIIMDINRDLKLSLQKLAEVLKSGRNLIIFPEGTRSKTGDLGKFKKTFAILSRELDVPVVPVAIKGAFDALPRGSFFPRPFKEINVRFLKPVYPEAHSYNSLIDEVFESVKTEIA